MIAQAAALVLAVASASGAPAFRTDGSLEPQDQVQNTAGAVWTDFSSAWVQASSRAPTAPDGPILLTRGKALRPGRNGMSWPGRVEVRQARDFVLDDGARTALRHELIHQFLFAACPAASEDRLFHEAMAVALSGELGSWNDGEYLSLPQAVTRLERARTLDDAQARRALARIIAEGLAPGMALPGFVASRLGRCTGGSWEPVRVSDLSAPERASTYGASFIVLSRHSGEVLAHEGPVEVPVPFGSTLKPLLVAGVRSAPPVLPVRATQTWSCGERLPPEMDVRLALLRSCNGYFLDWAAQEPSIAQLGRYGPLITALGLPRVPADAPEALGLKATLSIAPRRLAEAYRVLAIDRPDIIATLSHNAEEGTLSGLGLEHELPGVAFKTGTVRDGALRPVIGLIVAVDADLVAIMTRPGRMPRSFAPELARELAKVRRPSVQPVQLQVLGLLSPDSVRASCPRVGVVLGADGPQVVGNDVLPLSELTHGGPFLCAGAPVMVQFPGLQGSRPYAGTFRFAPITDVEAAPGNVSERARRARAGSTFQLTTTQLAYVSGVLAAEEDGITGPAREALARVILHNAAEPRHGPHGLCDTTHCQAFRGTVAPHSEDRAAADAPPLPYSGWLPFSRGGTEPWRDRRTRTEVEHVLGARPLHLRFGAVSVTFDRVNVAAEGSYPEPVTLGCELVRGPLKLPSCPERVREEEAGFVFEGHGQGHGLGLDLTHAKASGLDAAALLQEAYGKQASLSR